MDELSPEALPDGTLWGSWRVKRRAGYGTYGAVYQAHRRGRFHWKHRRSVNTHYQATPADDVYALGVTAYRLCTGIYPPPATDPSIVGDDGRDTQEVLVPPSQLKPLAPALERLILRMLSDRPQDRGSAVELASAMEAAADAAGAEADVPLNPSSRTSGVTSPPAPAPRQAGNWSGVLLPLIAGVLILVVESLRWEGFLAPPSGMTDGGTGGVADAAVEELPVSR
ncbi:hypothetical protein [Stigmatella aurantiaca]|uniref:Protein kinase n=1 Tax=Stigmatella aurantiaca (strain DW4/3-1) TaxID=378806 RepID=Q08P44_STIAD|nr:hypothetical protein [Stigmatella aurantiaca]ADO72125.1 Protein kinase [Stigmatella aurantiaca DW4/3-1]EAU62253.1 protein kinase [Stigmatella aurantiaca DW4/3-1]